VHVSMLSVASTTELFLFRSKSPVRPPPPRSPPPPVQGLTSRRVLIWIDTGLLDPPAYAFHNFGGHPLRSGVREYLRSGLDWPAQWVTRPGLRNKLLIPRRNAPEVSPNHIGRADFKRLTVKGSSLYVPPAATQVYGGICSQLPVRLGQTEDEAFPAVFD
jgi:hypothetical protein